MAGCMRVTVRLFHHPLKDHEWEGKHLCTLAALMPDRCLDYSANQLITQSLTPTRSFHMHFMADIMIDCACTGLFLRTDLQSDTYPTRSASLALSCWPSDGKKRVCFSGMHTCCVHLPCTYRNTYMKYLSANVQHHVDVLITSPKHAQ